MKKFKILTLMLLFLTCAASAFSSSKPTASETSADSYSVAGTDLSSLIGIWQFEDDPRYYYEFRKNNEYIRYKLDSPTNAKSGEKLFGSYTVVNGVTLRLKFNADKDEEMQFHIDDYNTLILMSGNQKAVCNRVSLNTFKRRTKRVTWSY